VLHHVVELLAPVRCLACRRRGAPVDGVWCPGCAAAVTAAPDPACRRCAGPRTVGHGCWAPGVPIETTTAVDDYRGPVAAAVVAAKVGGAVAAWPALARRLAGRVAQDPPAVDVVTWVATAPERARRRGVDHAEVLAAAAADAIAAPCLPLLRSTRHRDGERQRARRPLPATSVLLVDDVLTTGRTASGAAGALRRAGAGSIHLAVLARAGDHPLVASDATTGERAPPGPRARAEGHRSPPPVVPPASGDRPRTCGPVAAGDVRPGED
jgi:predicted amidophosphoribosyltransferase